MASADRALQNSTPPEELAEETSQRLVLQARDGDAAALNELIDTWRTYLFQLAESEISPELRQKVGVSDLVQSACVDLHHHFPDFQGETVGQWRAWVRQTLIHDVQDAHRRFLGSEKRDVSRERRLLDSEGLRYPLLDRGDTPSGELVAEEEAEALRQAMHQLPDDYRQVLQLRNWECLPFAEIGRSMDRSEEAARKLWARAVLRLQEEMLRDDEA